VTATSAGPPLPPRPAAVAGWLALVLALPAIAVATAGNPPPPRESGLPPSGVAGDPEGTTGRAAWLEDRLEGLAAGDAAARTAARDEAWREAARGDAAARLALARALAALRAPAGRAVLRRLASDPDARVAVAAREALLETPGRGRRRGRRRRRCARRPAARFRWTGPGRCMTM
jgi:hypothetical protein